MSRSKQSAAVNTTTKNQFISQQLAKPLAKKVVYPVEKGLRSEESKKLYRWHFNAFTKWLEKKYNTIIVDERLVLLGGEQIQILLTDYIEYLAAPPKNLKYATINAAMASVIHFCDMNDIYVNRKKIGKSLPEVKRRKDRAYRRDEIQTLIDNSDKRFKVVILLMASTGMRIGAIPDLRLCHLTPMSVTEKDDASITHKVYKIVVYEGTGSEYYTFVTPECAKYIDDYLDFRREQKEPDVTIHPENQAPLIREQFRLNDKEQAKNPQFVSQSTLEKHIERIVQKANTNTVRKVMITHGFRKFAITMMAEADIRYVDREFLVGHRHSIGLDREYYKPTEDKRFIEWTKAINYLTINPAYQANIELREIKGEMAQKVAQLEARNAKLEAEYQEIGDVMKWLSGLKKENKEELVNEFYKLTAGKVQDEWYDSDEYKQWVQQEQRQRQQKQQQKQKK